jgi:FAD/FMN-containing dehydrogenase
MLSVDAPGADALSGLRNPFFIEEQPGGYHTTGRFGAFDTHSVARAVAGESPDDIADVVRFVRERGLRLAIKNTGHDYLGRSSGSDALLLWTHPMRQVSVHNSFTPAGMPPDAEPNIPAVAVGAGARWLEVYQALGPHRRLALGGGCTTVGAAGGFIQGGGFGSFSKAHGTAAGNVLEMDVVTADGERVVASAHSHPDLFWALRGGGGGTFGVVSSVTYRTHPMPRWLSAVRGSVRASSPAALPTTDKGGARPGARAGKPALGRADRPAAAGHARAAHARPRRQR